MKFPFPKWLPKIPVKVYWEGTDSNGEYVEELIYDGPAFLDEKSRQVLDAERRLVMLSGLIIIEGDIYPGEPIQGYVMIGNVKKAIHSTLSPRNPDGTVYSTELNLS